ncbi:hypothetical protein H5410_002551 [Solanum commersonii]|uniref:Gag-pol polyprotein n=1 Tax=Solanum commersonii TaxID=4109 RepID=A0A9J6B2L9_SOLCO|nr:hypothetical protein H5410_002551 [Solanum commersonii]
MFTETKTTRISELQVLNRRAVWHNGSLETQFVLSVISFSWENVVLVSMRGRRAQASSAPPPGRTTPKGANLGTNRGLNRLYAISSFQDHESSPNVITSILKVFSIDVYTLLDPSASLSFVTPYVAMSVYTYVGESILVGRVYRDCTFYVYHKDTMTDLVELDMVDFDVILVMDWVHACYASVECRT